MFPINNFGSLKSKYLKSNTGVKKRIEEDWRDFQATFETTFRSAATRSIVCYCKIGGVSQRSVTPLPPARSVRLHSNRIRALVGAPRVRRKLRNVIIFHERRESDVGAHRGERKLGRRCAIAFNKTRAGQRGIRHGLEKL